MTDYAIGLDKNGDGFICMDAQPGDPLNLLTDAIELLPLNDEAVGSANVSLQYEATAYGLRLFSIVYPTAATGTFALGKTGTIINTIPVTPGKTYSTCAWMRGLANYGSYALQFRMFNQDDTLLADNSFVPATGWAQISLTFTAGVNDAYIYFSLRKPEASAVAMAVDLTGFMLVEGDTLPDGFNTGDPRDLDDFITPDVLKMRWRLGFAQPDDAVSSPTRGELVVRNVDGAYSPELAAITLDPGTPVQVRVSHEGQTLTLFSGMIAHVAPEPGDLAGRTATIHLNGPEHPLDETTVLTPLLTNTSAGSVITAALNHPALNRFNRTLDTGVSAFAYVGDTWSDGIPARQAIRQIVEAERGRFFTDRHGYLIFHDRNHAVPASSATFANAFDALTYHYGDRIVNHVRVRVRPRSIGSSGAVIWQGGTPQRIAAGTCQTITARLRDSTGSPMGATNVIAPVAVTDYSANTAADGSGTDITTQVSITLTTSGTYASALMLDICNTAAVDAYVWLQVRGTPLMQADTLLVEASDLDSQLQYGVHRREFNLPYFVTITEAEELAQAIINARAQPSGAVKTLTLSNRTRFTDALTHTLFDVVTVTEGRTGHSADYCIIAEAHDIDLGGHRHQVTWVLEGV